MSFQRTTPESVGIPSKAISAFLHNVQNSGIELHSLMILRHGKVCAEGWWKPYSPDRIHNIHSFTKTFVASALGMLVHEGKVSLDQTVVSFFPESVPDNADEKLLRMNLHHLLSMSTGHAVEPAIRGEKDFIGAFFAHPVVYEPGTHFRYNSMATHMIGRIIHKITGQTFVELLQERMFKPMGFGKMDCTKLGDGFPSGGGGFAMTTEDMCRLGQLYLNGGKWNGMQIVPEEWIRTATVPQCDNSNGEHRDGNEDWEAGYGYQLWMNAPARSYRFDGAYGQLALVCPEQDLLIVCNSGTGNLAHILRCAWRFILEKCMPSPLPENPTALSELRAEMESLTLPELVSCGRSWMEAQASGCKLTLAKNDVAPFFANAIAGPAPERRGVTAITPVFKDGELQLTIETPDGTQTLRAGMNGSAIANTIDIDTLDREFHASAKWTDQNVLSVTWRTLRVIQTITMTITYHLNDAEVRFTAFPVKPTHTDSPIPASLQKRTPDQNAAAKGDS